MDRAFVAGIAATLISACGGSSGPATNFTATLSGANEVPPTTSTATGTATLTLSGTTMNYTVTYSGLSGPPTASHIHLGAAGVAGAVVVPFSGIPSTASGSFSGSFTSANIQASTNPPVATLDDLLVQMRARAAYVNIHSAQSPGGEIRGQTTPK
jgi:hypothetical protein